MTWYEIILIVLAGVLGVTAIVTYGIARYFSNMVLHPKLWVPEEVKQKIFAMDFMTDDFKTAVEGAEKIEIKSTLGYTLRGIIIPAQKGTSFADNKDRVIVICHGWTNCYYQMLKYASFLWDLGFACVMYDHRNHGSSDKRPTSMGKYEQIDLTTVCELAKKRYPNSVMGTLGESMGAGTNMNNVKDNHLIDFAIDDCGYATLRGQLEDNLTHNYHLTTKPFMFFAGIIMKLEGKFNIDEVKPVDSVASREDLPILFIHGDADGFVQLRNVYEFYEAKKGPKDIYICEGAGHAKSIEVNREKYVETVKNFLTKYGFI